MVHDSNTQACISLFKKDDISQNEKQNLNLALDTVKMPCTTMQTNRLLAIIINHFITNIKAHQINIQRSLLVPPYISVIL